MGRVINTNNPTTERNRNRRLIAELLRRLVSKGSVDEETRDMAATIVLALVEIDAGVRQTVAAWEKRDYWMKAERFLRDWDWVRESAANLDDVIRHEAWDLLPGLLLELAPQFGDVQINRYTRNEDAWLGNYERLLDHEPLELPY